MSIQKFHAWCQFYAQEEPQLALVYSISRDNFPNIGLGFPCPGGLFIGGFVVLHPPGKVLTPELEESMYQLAGQGYFVASTTDWEVAQEIVMNYLKTNRGPAWMDDPRFLPEDISLN